MKEQSCKIAPSLTREFSMSKKEKRKAIGLNLYVSTEVREQIFSDMFTGGLGYIVTDACGNTMCKYSEPLDDPDKTLALYKAVYLGINYIVNNYECNYVSVFTDGLVILETKMSKRSANVKNVITKTLKLIESCNWPFFIIRSDGEDSRKHISDVKELLGKHKFKAPKDKYKNKKPDFIIYTDGACNNLSPEGEGGYAYIVLDGDEKELRQFSEGVLHTTNNIMELKAIIEGCKSIEKENAIVEVRSDSQYAIGVLSGKYTARKNTELISEHFKENVGRLHIRFKKVKAHADDEFNCMADQLAEDEVCRIRAQYCIPYYDSSNSPKIGNSPYSYANKKWRY